MPGLKVGPIGGGADGRGQGIGEDQEAIEFLAVTPGAVEGGLEGPATRASLIREIRPGEASIDLSPGSPASSSGAPGHNGTVGDAVTQIDVYSCVSLASGDTPYGPAHPSLLEASLRLLKACVFVADAVDVHNPLPPPRPDDFAEFIAAVRKELEGYPADFLTLQRGILRETSRLRERSSVEWSIDRYTEALAALRRGVPPDGLDWVQLAVLSMGALRDFDLEAEMAMMAAEAPDQLQLLLDATAIAEAAASARPNRNIELHPGDELFLILRAHRLLTSRTSAAVLDAPSEAELRHYLDQGLSGEAAFPMTEAGRALSVAPLYVLRAVPHLAEMEVELLLEWREVLGESLASYRAAVIEATAAASGVDRTDTDAFLASVGPILDLRYSEVSRQAKSSGLWAVARERSASFAGPAVPAGLVLAASPDQPVAALTTLAVGTLTQAIVLVVEKMRRSAGRSHHPLYWRYALTDGAAPSG